MESSYLCFYIHNYPPLETVETSQEYVKRCHKLLPILFYQNMVKIICGPFDHGKIRLFHGYFGENSDLAFVLFVGENAVLYQKNYE